MAYRRVKHQIAHFVGKPGAWKLNERSKENCMAKDPL